MRVILDGVFNHASRGFWAFHHILENGANSPYVDWFLIQGWPLRPYASDALHPPNYACWWGLPALPKFNLRNPGVREYLLEVARYWMAFGADGWRLDVPSEIEDDRFWRQWRQVVKTANPEAYLCGEIWQPAQRWLQGDQFDAVMNYPFSRAALSFFGAQDPFCRAAFPWNDAQQWDRDLLAGYRRAIALRHSYSALRTGTFQRLYARGGVYAFSRCLHRQCAVVIFNTQPRAITVDVQTPHPISAAWDQKTQVPGYSGARVRSLRRS